MKYKTLSLLTVICMGLSHPATTVAAETDIIIPDEFSSMFIEKEDIFSFQISGSESSRHTRLSVTPLSGRIVDKTELAGVRLYLKKSGLVANAIDAIIAQLSGGIKNNAECTGFVAKCQFIPEQFAFGFDYDNKLMLLFVNSSLMNTQKNQRRPHDARNATPGLINHLDVDVGYYGNGSTNLTARDETVLGLTRGNISSTLYANTSNNDIDIDELAYNYEWERSRFQAGHYKYGYTQNTTGTLDLTGSYSQDVVSLSSSRNLVDGGAKNTRQLTYFLPGQGRIEVYRDDRLIYGANVSSGQQSVPYRSLPSGNYPVTVVIKSSGREVLREQQQIYNTASFLLGKGDVDYALSTGHFNDRYNNDVDNTDINATVNYDELELSSAYFVDGRVSYQLLDNVLVGARAVATADEHMVETVVTQDIADVANATIKYAVFDNKSRFFSINGGVLGIGLGYEQYSPKGDTYTLDNYMLSNTGYSRLTASTGAEMFGGSGYLTYIQNDADEEMLLNNGFDDQSDYWSLTAGYSRPFIASSTLDFSFSYQGSNDKFGDDDDWYASLLWEIPLGDEWRGGSSVSFSKEGVDEFRNSVARDVEGESYYATTEAGVNYNGETSDRSMTSDVSFSGNYTGKGFQSDTYAYAESNGTKSINVGFSSSQVFDGDNVYVTPEKSDAYVVLNADNHEDSDNHRGLLTVAHAGDVRYTENVDTNKTVLPVNNYNNYTVRLDTESSNYIQSDRGETQGYSFPGTVINLSVDLTKIKTFITSFDDIDKHDIDSIRCQGDGCVGIEKLTDGVFKVSVIVGSDYELVSNNQTCITPTLDRETSRIVNLGLNYCLPGIEDDTRRFTSIKAVEVGDKDYYFVGVYSSDVAIDSATNELHQLGLNSVTRRIGKRRYLYAQSASTLTANQKEQIESLWRYAMNTLDNNQFALWR